MDRKQKLRLLEAADGDPAKLTLAVVDLAYPELAEGERASLKETLEAAAIPHWFDAKILAALLAIPREDSDARFERLRRLSIVEPFPARGSDVVNVHETARLSLRKSLATDQGARFQRYSARAAELYEGDSTPVNRIEWIYHLLCAKPDIGAMTLEVDERDWSRVARPEDRHALAVALGELEESGLVQGAARLQVLFAIAWARVSRGQAAQLGDLAKHAFDLAKSVGNLHAEGEAQALLGDVMKALGRLNDSRNAYEDYLAVGRHLVKQNPAQTASRRELAIALKRVGGVLQALGKLPEAEAAFEEALMICRQLAEQEPSSPGWQWDLAIAYNWVGGVMEAQGNPPKAQEAFGKSLEIRRGLSEKDPTNADWNLALAIAHRQVGGLLQAQQRLVEAQAAFEEALAINRRWAEQDPSNAQWQWGLGVAYHRIGGVMEAQQRLPEAQIAFAADLAICKNLAEQDPSNANWQSGLLETHLRLGSVMLAQAKPEEARAAFEDALAIGRSLSEREPSNADLQRKLAIACVRVAKSRSADGDHTGALPYFEEAYAIFDALCNTELASPDWAKQRAGVLSELESCRKNVESERQR